MAKLNKAQVQAIISKLSREATALRNDIIKEKKQNYVLSDNAIKLRKLIEEKNTLKVKLSTAEDDIKSFINSIGLAGVYYYTNVEEAMDKIEDKEINAEIPSIDYNAALDDLIIESISDDFNVDEFIGRYLNQLKNG